MKLIYLWYCLSNLKKKNDFIDSDGIKFQNSKLKEVTSCLYYNKICSYNFNTKIITEFCIFSLFILIVKDVYKKSRKKPFQCNVYIRLALQQFKIL